MSLIWWLAEHRNREDGGEPTFDLDHRFVRDTSSAPECAHRGIDRSNLIDHDAAGHSSNARNGHFERPRARIASNRTYQDQARDRIVSAGRDDDGWPTAGLFVTERRSKINPNDVTYVQIAWPRTRHRSAPSLHPSAQCRSNPLAATPRARFPNLRKAVAFDPA